MEKISAQTLTRYASILRRRAARFGFNASDAEDLTQRALLTYWKKSDRVLPGREGAFVQAILLREMARAKRTYARRREAVDHENAPQSSGAPRLDEALHQRRLLGRLDAIFERMPVTHRRVFALHALEGLTCEEIAARENLPLGTVKTRVRSARSALLRAGGVP
jgi:RNA polymerase sigma-70 factor, ECF subfamily